MASIRAADVPGNPAGHYQNSNHKKNLADKMVRPVSVSESEQGTLNPPDTRSSHRFRTQIRAPGKSQERPRWRRNRELRVLLVGDRFQITTFICTLPICTMSLGLKGFFPPG
jgi:hypothetical protein